MRSRALPTVALSAAALILGTTFAGTATAAAPSSRPSIASHQGVAKVAPMGIDKKKKKCKFNQTDPAGDTGTAIVSQNFESAFDAYDATAADDFHCKKGVKKIKKVVAVGQYFNGAGPATSVHVRVLADAAGEPSDGAALCDYPSQPYTDLTGFGTFSVTLGGACALSAGTVYWLEVSADMDFSVGGEWGWENTSEDNSPADTLYAADWRNPGNGFASGCTVYQNGIDMQTCLGGVAPAGNFMFSVGP